MNENENKRELENCDNQESQEQELRGTDDKEQPGQEAETVDLNSFAKAVRPKKMNAKAVEEIMNRLEEEKSRYLRLAAEYDNFRKRSAKERESIFSDAYISAVSVFLPLYDNVERAMAVPCSDEAYKKGVELIMKQLLDIFERLEIKETPGVGEPFDPKFHNAVMHVEDENLPEGVVAEIFQKGFIMKDRVLRYAMVKAAN